MKTIPWHTTANMKLKKKKEIFGWRNREQFKIYSHKKCTREITERKHSSNE